MTRIFISYRRQDTLAIAGRIFDRLEAKFGSNGVFMDIDSIPPGVDFHGWLDDEVSQASVVLALIGAGWLNAQDEAGLRRLDSPNDFVRIEIETALRRSIPLVPVLIGGASMPRADELPESLRPVLRRHAAEVDMGRDFHRHMDRLIVWLERHADGHVDRPRSGTQSARNDALFRAEGRIEIHAAVIHNSRGRWFLPGAGKTEWFQDLAEGAEMVAVPEGSYIMGAPDKEQQRVDDEGPQHKVTFANPFAVGRYPVTVGQFANFVRATGYNAGNDWRNPGFMQNDNHPVVCMNWDDAQAYVKWWRERTGKDYRLLSEAEWEYACRAGTVSTFWWGTTITPAQANYDGNFVYEGGGSKGECRKQTVPVNSFEPNPWGLYQVHGNVREWCEDVWHENYVGAPSDGSAWIEEGDKTVRILRGGSWVSFPQCLRSARRTRTGTDRRIYGNGFRLARTL